MGVTNRKSRDTGAVRTIMDNIVFTTACRMQNGSITIIKQDNIVIQVNINEKIKLNRPMEKGNRLKEARV